jgi:hypothetical protein
MLSALLSLFPFDLLPLWHGGPSNCLPIPGYNVALLPFATVCMLGLSSFCLEDYSWKFDSAPAPNSLTGLHAFSGHHVCHHLRPSWL